MRFITSIYAILLFLTGVLSIQLAFIVLRRRHVPGCIPFVGFLLSGAWWALLNALEALPWDQTTEVWISQAQYFGKESVPVFYILFALEYTRLVPPLRRSIRIGLWIIPALAVLAVLSNGSHHLFWSRIYPDPYDVPGTFIYEHGPLFWFTFSYNYLLMLIGSLLLLYFAFHSMQLYRRQALALLAGIIVAWGANGLYISGLTPRGLLDLTPLAGAITAAIYAWGIFHLRLFDLLPVARNVLIEEMSDGVLVVDLEDRIIDLNPAACNLINACSDQIGKPASEVFPPWKDLLAAEKGQNRLHQELLIPSTPTRYLEVRIAALHSHQGRLTGRLVILRDITEYKQLENMRTDLIHTIVHDLRNPLTNVIMVLETLQQTPPPQQEGLLTIARDSAGRMLNLINSILDITRLERGQVEIQQNHIDLKMLVNGTLQSQSPLAQTKNIQVINDLSSGLPFILGDTSLIRRILQNLIGNALNFTPENGTVRITATQISPKQIAVSIIDSGPGIPADVQPHLFQMFAGGRARGGSGIGLAFCRLAVEAHDGRIWAENLSTGGAKFSFILPAVEK